MNKRLYTIRPVSYSHSFHPPGKIGHETSPLDPCRSLSADRPKSMKKTPLQGDFSWSTALGKSRLSAIAASHATFDSRLFRVATMSQYCVNTFPGAGYVYSFSSDAISGSAHHKQGPIVLAHGFSLASAPCCRASWRMARGGVSVQNKSKMDSKTPLYKARRAGAHWKASAAISFDTCLAQPYNADDARPIDR
jgi:hypothetical protein